MQNTSGFEPVANLLLVRMDEVDDLHSGLLAKPEHAIAEERLSQPLCTCIAEGPLAWFRELDENGNRVPRCKVGDHIRIEQWVGQYFKSRDGHYYRIIVDRNVIGRVIEEEKPV